MCVCYVVNVQEKVWVEDCRDCEWGIRENWPEISLRGPAMEQGQDEVSLGEKNLR